MNINKSQSAISAALLLLASCSSITPADKTRSQASPASMLSAANSSPTIITCPSLPPSNQCQFTNSYQPGQPLWLFGNLISADTIYQNGGIGIDGDGKITSVGCVTAPPDQATITCANQIISPGLINPHDHLSYNQNFPVGKTIVTAMSSSATLGRVDLCR